MYSFVLAANRSLPLAALLAVTVLSGPRAHAQPGWVLSHQKISATEGGFKGELDSGVQFGTSVVMIGDLDGDGVGDLAVGSLTDSDGGVNRGAVWILFLNNDGTVKAHQKISDTEGGFTGLLDNGDEFGNAVAALGDLDGDGVLDLAVGTAHDDDGGNNQGAVWILFLNNDGTVKAHQKVSETQGGFSGDLDEGDLFGAGVVAIGDHNGDGIVDLAVGVQRDGDGGAERGAVWILFLNSDGTVSSNQKLSATEGGFTGSLDDMDWFGVSVGWLGDLDGDGVGDMIVGAPKDDDGGANRGALWVLFLNVDGTVKSHQKISATTGNFQGLLSEDGLFGWSVAGIADVDGNTVNDAVVGAKRDSDNGVNGGAVWVLLLNSDGTVNQEQKISETSGGFQGDLDLRDQFGSGVATLGDLDGDGLEDIAVGALGDDDGGSSSGAVWVLFLDGVSTIDLDLDIKPGSCPNSFNRNSNGVLPVALVGTDDFDVTTVDLGSILLVRKDGVGGSIAPHEGPPGPHSVFEDVATPFEGDEQCDCAELEGDGFLDLSLKFKSSDLVEALDLDDLKAGELVSLTLKGNLLDGTPFEADDCIRLVPPGGPPGLMAMGSNAPGVFISITPLDETLDGGGFVDFVDFVDFKRTYSLGTIVTLTAPQTHLGWVFVGWDYDRSGISGLTVTHQGGLGDRTIEIIVLDAEFSLKAIYQPGINLP